MHEIFEEFKLVKVNKYPTVIGCCMFTHPKVAGAEFRTSGGTYAAVPTNVQALSSVHKCTRINKWDITEFYDNSMLLYVFSY